jgi:hypothetical protein
LLILAVVAVEGTAMHRDSLSPDRYVALIPVPGAFESI